MSHLEQVTDTPVSGLEAISGAQSPKDHSDPVYKEAVMRIMLIICTLIFAALALFWVASIRASDQEDCEARCQRINQCEMGSASCTWETTCGAEPFSCEVQSKKPN